MWTQWVRDARGELTHLRAVTGKKGATDKDHAVQGRTRALEYLTGSTATLEALGEPMVAALLTAVGPAHFEVNAEGRRLLQRIAKTTSRPSLEAKPCRKEERCDDADEPRGEVRGNLFDDDERDEADGEAADEALDDTVSASSDSTPAIDLALWEKKSLDQESTTDYISYGVAVAPLILDLQTGAKETREFFLRAIIVAAEVMRTDPLRKHLT